MQYIDMGPTLDGVREHANGSRFTACTAFFMALSCGCTLRRALECACWEMEDRPGRIALWERLATWLQGRSGDEELPAPVKAWFRRGSRW